MGKLLKMRGYASSEGGLLGLKKRNMAIEGLRGLAILLVVASHTGVLGQGGVGVAIFLALSGFFASSPFRTEFQKDSLTPKGILKYYLARIVRVCPVYWVTIALVYLLTTGYFTDARQLLRCALFIECPGHFWFLQQVMFFYLCTPAFNLLLFGVDGLARKLRLSGHLACAAALILLSWLSYRYLTVGRAYLMGNGGKQVIRFFQFLPGMAAGYLYKWIRAHRWDEAVPRGVKILLGVYPILFFLFCILSSGHIITLVYPESTLMIGWDMPVLCSGLTCVCVLAFLLAPDSFSNKLYASLVFRYVGEISFPTFIIHWYLLGLFHKPYAAFDFIAVLTLTLGAATLAHVVIEEPCAMLYRNRKWSEVREYFAKF